MEEPRPVARAEVIDAWNAFSATSNQIGFSNSQHVSRRAAFGTISHSERLFEGDMPLALDVLREACELEPSSLFFKAQLADVALAANRPREVIEVFADVAPCDNGYAFKLAYAHFLTGDLEAAAEGARTFEACFPAQWEVVENHEALAQNNPQQRGTAGNNLTVVKPVEARRLSCSGLLSVVGVCCL